VDEYDVLGVLGAASQAFIDALKYPEGPRTIAVVVEASCPSGIVEISVHDYSGQNGNTVELQRPLTPPLPKVAAAQRA
jgi:hypothetical protein